MLSKHNVLRSTQHHIQPWNVKPESNHEKTSNQNQDALSITIVQNSSTFQNYQGHERQKLKHHSRLKKTKET